MMLIAEEKLPKPEFCCCGGGVLKKFRERLSGYGSEQDFLAGEILCVF